MNRFHAIALIVCLALPGAAFAQAAPERHTGDAWVDARLADIDAYAAMYREAFVDEMVRYRRAPREFVQELLARPGWTPGDAYYVCSLAQRAGRPCREIADLRNATPPTGLDALAHDLGVVPGSPAFHALKREIIATYDRWARPVRTDAELAPDYPQRPREAPKAPASSPVKTPPPGR